MPPLPPLAPLAALRWAVVEPLLEELRPTRILEIGCGIGGFGARMATRAQYIGVEADRASYEAARPAITPHGGTVVHGHLSQIDLDQGFDLVCAFEVIEHIDDDATALAEWAEHVAPKGAVLLSVPAGPDRFGPWDASVGHFRRYDGSHLDRLITGAGFTDVRHVYYGWPLGYATEYARNRLVARKDHSAGATTSDRTAASGRQFQPGRRATGVAIRAAVAPWAAAQRLRPSAGVGLVGVGRKSEPPAQAGQA
jgi:SAM-dependent methyltransferase